VGLFDAIREKAGELLSGATEKVGDLAGDVPGSQEVQDLTQSAGDVAGQAGEQVSGTAQDLGATATGAAEDLSGSVTDALPETYRP
jgi:hypothetical protein